MSLLDDLRSLAAYLPSQVKPVEAELVDVVAGIVHTLEHAGIGVPPAPPAAEPPSAVTAATEPETVGGAVYDVAAAGPVAPPVSPGPAGPAAPPAGVVAELEAEIRVRQDELQSLQIRLADAQKTQASGS